jgi:hypothetical protein
MNYLSQEDQRDELRGRAIEDVTQKFRVSGSATGCSTCCTTSEILT